MPLTPLGATQSGMQIPGMSTQPYPDLGPAQGGIGAGASQSPPPQDDAEDEARQLQLIAQMMQMFEMGPLEAKGALAGAGLRDILKQLRGAKKPRGLSEDLAQGKIPPSMQQQPAMPPQMSATPMPPTPSMG